MGEENKETDMERIGLFKEMGYLHGTEYVPFSVSFNEASRKGKQMMTNCSRKKQEGYFSEFQRAFEGEGYMDRIAINRRPRLENTKKILGRAFKPTSPSKKPCGLGSTFGTFAEYEGTIKAFSPAERDHEKGQPVKRNVITNPAKKGTGYGYPNVTIGEMPPYLLEKDWEKLKNIRVEHVPTKHELKYVRPFMEGMREQEYFDSNPFFTDAPGPIYNKQIKETPVAVPFVPSGCSKKDGGMKAGCLNPWPEYKENPYLMPDLVGRGVKRYVNKENRQFRPVPGRKEYPIKSVIDTNIKKEMNITNFATTKGVVYCKK